MDNRYDDFVKTWWYLCSCIQEMLNNYSYQNHCTKQRKTWPTKICINEMKLVKYSHCFSSDQAAIAAFFWACFLVLPGLPVNVFPANSTVHVNTGVWPGPDLTVVYTGSFKPARWAVSWSRFLYIPVSSCGVNRVSSSTSTTFLKRLPCCTHAHYNCNCIVK